MQKIKHCLTCLLVGLIAVNLAACAAPQGSTPAAATVAAQDSPPLSVASSATPAPSATAPAPIVSTAVAEVSQALPTPTETLIVAEAAGRIITRGDHGKTLSLQTGQQFVLMLDDRYVWEIRFTDPQAVVLVEEGTGGGQGVYEARQAGQTQLTATGDPLCRGQKPACMMPTLIFTLHIVVS
jgi:hypothetical protein